MMSKNLIALRLHLIKDYQNPEDLLGENRLLKQLTKALPGRAMKAELTDELGFAKNDKSSLKENSNRRNRTSAKTIKSKVRRKPKMKACSRSKN